MNVLFRPNCLFCPVGEGCGVPKVSLPPGEASGPARLTQPETAALGRCATRLNSAYTQFFSTVGVRVYGREEPTLPTQHLVDEVHDLAGVLRVMGEPEPLIAIEADSQFDQMV